MFNPPDYLDAKEAKLWVKMRDVDARGNVATSADADLLAQLVHAKVKLAEANAMHKKPPLGVSLAAIRREQRYWFNQHRLLLVKCKFLRAEVVVEANKPTNPWVALLALDPKKIPDKKFKSPHVDALNKFAKDVVSGKILACSFVKQSCQRHIDDMARKEWRYTFSPYLANRAIEIINNLPHVKGRWAKYHELIRLEPWECFLVGSVFGWVDKKTFARRYRETYWEICRKNGKSILAAAIGIVMFLGDGEHGAEVFSGATTEKQAWEVFRPARLMLAHTPLLCEAAGVSVHAKHLLKDDDHSRFEPVIGKPGDGSSPSCAIIDEFHEHDTPDMYDTMSTGMLAREQPLLLAITTAGFNLSGPCYEKRTKAIQVLNGTLHDDSLFPMIYTIDLPNKQAGIEGDEWGDPKSLVKANPNLGVSVDREFLEAAQRSAVINVSEETKFKTKHLNVWCAARAAWISLQQWQLAADTQLEEKELEGTRCWFMFDLASKSDIAAYLKVFMKLLNGHRHYYIFGRYYVPEEMITSAHKNQFMYAKWHKQGILTATDGATTDFERIRDDIVTDAKIYSPEEVVYDPFNATYMSQLLIDEGLTLVEFTQKPANFAVPMDEVQSALKDGRLHHDGNEMLQWMMANVTVRPAKKGLFWPTKETPEAKIDGPVAMIMGIARAMVAGESGIDQFLRDPVMA